MADALQTSHRAQGKVSFFTQYLSQAVEIAWLVIESVPERLELKKLVFEELSKLAATDCILGSNSSSFKSSLMLDNMDATVGV